MPSEDELPRRARVTYRRSNRVQDEETVPDSEDSTSPAETRPLNGEDSSLVKQPILVDQPDPPRPPRAVYRARKCAVSPPPLSYASMASAEEVIPDSEDNSRSLGTSDDGDADDNSKNSPFNTRKTISRSLSDWKQKLRDIDDDYETDEDTQSPHTMPSAVSHPKNMSLNDPFGNPPTTQTSSRADESLSSPLHHVSSSTDTTPQFVFGTPQAPSHTPPTSDGKPSPIPKTRAKAKGKGKVRPPPTAEEATIDDPLVSSPDGVRQTRCREKAKKSKVRILFYLQRVR
jgi:hypothetical protein